MMGGHIVIMGEEFLYIPMSGNPISLKEGLDDSVEWQHPSDSYHKSQCTLK